MKLDEWIRDPHDNVQFFDVMVQVLYRYIQKGEGVGCLCANNYEVETHEIDTADGTKSEVFDVSFVGGNGYDDSFHPVPDLSQAPTDDEIAIADSFCFGCMMYNALTNSTVSEFDRAERLLNRVAADISCPFLRGDDDGFGSSLIKELTDLNIKKRLSLRDCLKRIIGEFGGTAIICITERTTLVNIERIKVKLSNAEHVWVGATHYRLGSRGFVSEILDGSITIPYRLVELEYSFYVVSDDLPEPERWQMTRLADKRAIGIDFGTWTSSVSYVNDDGYTEDILFGGKNVTRTAIRYLSRDEMIFGDEAVTADSFVDLIKRNLDAGTAFTVATRNGEVVNESYYDATVRYLRFLYEEMMKSLNCTQDKALIVLTVPACYDPGMKTSLLGAAKEAGFSPEILTEPEAAAFFFGMRYADDGGHTLVLDIGGGTSDISLINFKKRNGEQYPDISSEHISGIGALGGVDLTEKIALDLKENLQINHDLDMSNAKVARLTEACFEMNCRVISDTAEKIKLALTSADTVSYEMNLRFPDSAEVQTISVKYKRQQYEQLIKDEVVKLRNKLKQVVGENSKALRDINNLVIVGGASITPSIRRMAVNLFEGTQCKIHYVDYGTVVSRGAAIYANERLLDCTKKQVLSETIYDIGMLQLNYMADMPTFTVLLRAGTPFTDEGIKFSASCIPTKHEIEGGYCRLYLYRRPCGFDDVTSTFCAEGDIIRPIGSFYIASYPQGFDPATGRIEFIITLDSQECLSASTVFYIPQHGLGREQFRMLCMQLSVFKPNSQNEDE